MDPVRSKSLKVGNSSFSCVSLQKLSKIFKSLGFGLSVETFTNFWRVSVSEKLASEKNLGFGFVKFGL